MMVVRALPAVGFQNPDVNEIRSRVCTVGAGLGVAQVAVMGSVPGGTVIGSVKGPGPSS